MVLLTQDCVLGYVQPSPFDKLRAGSAGLDFVMVVLTHLFSPYINPA